MTLFYAETERRIVPRWRDFSQTVSNGHLVALQPQTQELAGVEELLNHRLEDWQVNKTISFASELVGAAFVAGREHVAEEAAQFLLSNPTKVSAPALELASRVVRPGWMEDLASNDLPVSIEEIGEVEPRMAVHATRLRLIDEPRNALAYVDMARQYTILGFYRQAERVLRMALYLAPDNRFVLRCVARFCVHVGDPDQGLRVLRKSSATLGNPWLLAAEIAVAMVAGRAPRHIRIARRIIGADDYAPLHISELSCAVATLELASGNARAARRLFRRSLVEPTDNSVAQVDWATRRMSGFSVDQEILTVPRSYEARALAAY